MAWTIKLAAHDIGLRVWFVKAEDAEAAEAMRLVQGKQSFGGDAVEVVKSARVDAHSGSFVAESPGVVVVELSNTHSWVRGKDLSVHVDVTPPAAAVAGVAGGGAAGSG